MDKERRFLTAELFGSALWRAPFLDAFGLIQRAANIGNIEASHPRLKRIGRWRNRPRD
jgi:hypothetical protein